MEKARSHLEAPKPLVIAVSMKPGETVETVMPGCALATIMLRIISVALLRP